jgi:RNase P subunit RPR2
MIRFEACSFLRYNKEIRSYSKRKEQKYARELQNQSCKNFYSALYLQREKDTRVDKPSR